MKNTKRFLLAVFSAIVLCLTFVFATACATKVEGTYKFSKMSYVQSGVSVEIKAGEQFMGFMTLNEDFMQMTLNEDGTIVIVAAEEEAETGTWVKEGNTLKITDKLGEVTEATCDGKTITFTEMDEDLGAEVTIVLKK